MARLTSNWEFRIRQDDLSITEVVTVPMPDCGSGEVILRVDRVGLTANNVTYAALGASFRYWEFFPTEHPWGLVPLWGFADVLESQVAGIDVGERFYGYYPSSGYLRVRPGRVDSRGFADAAEHRRGLPSPYNTYARTATDAVYQAAKEDLLVLYRPLFLTSLMWADWLLERHAFGAERVVFSSASSKTAYGAAFCLRMLEREGRRQGNRLELIGVTSSGNRAFTAELGLYDSVVTYDELATLDGDAITVFADFLGNPEVSQQVQETLGAALAQSVVVGITSQDTSSAGELAGVGGDEAFFAPVQVRHRIESWGLSQVDTFLARVWLAFVDRLPEWVDVRVSSGPEKLEQLWHEVQSGRAEPHIGHVIQM